MEVNTLLVLSKPCNDAMYDGMNAENTSKLSGNILPVKIGSVTVNAVLDTGTYANMISHDFYNKICVFQPGVKMDCLKRTRMKDVN